MDRNLVQSVKRDRRYVKDERHHTILNLPSTDPND